MDNKLLKNIQTQIKRLGGEIRQSATDEFHGIKLSKTMKAFVNTDWNSEYCYEFFDSDPAEVEIVFEMDYLGNNIVKSELTIEFVSIGYDELVGYNLVIPLSCLAMQDPPVYKIDVENQNRLNAPSGFVEIINRLEICQNIPQELFLEDGLRFPDNNLANRIRKELHKTDGVLTKDNLADVKNIILADAEIRTLEGIEHLANLQELTLDGNQVTDVAPLTRLQNLEYLSIRNNAVEDFSPLQEMPKLVTIYNNGNPGIPGEEW